MTLEIIQIPVLRDNYSYLLKDSGTQTIGIVDPSEAEPIIPRIEELGGRLDYIFNTHHHEDHTGGNKELKKRYDAKVIASAVDQKRIAAVDIQVHDRETLPFGSLKVEVIATPGHTHGHVVYWFKEQRALFCGDVLFSLSCGNVFEGTADDMCRSLKALYQLPDDTSVYSAHEYTRLFVPFALKLDPHNPEMQRKKAEVTELHEKGKPTVPFPLGPEKRLNPYLRIFDPSFARMIKGEGLTETELFKRVSQLDE
jgi:hydroxyacylglutathione hydrolase